jgi:23S rRNA pseudouridine1911/1915/1917 synthase
MHPTPLTPAADPDLPFEDDEDLVGDPAAAAALAAPAAAAGPLTVTVPAEAAPDRADRVLAGLLDPASGLSRSRVKQLIGDGAVRLDGATLSDPSAKVKPGQIFAIIIPDLEPAVPRPQPIPLVIPYEDEDLIIIDKPAGLVVHPAPGNEDFTLVNALLHHCGESLTGIGGVLRPGIVHRIDKDTSGLLVAAKSAAAHAGLALQFAAHTVERSYQAVVWGTPSPAQGEIEATIGRDPGDRKRMAVVRRGGKTALTRYRVLRHFAAGAGSLVECRLETGRTHQIRVHLTHIGHPLVGDQTYGRITPHRRRMMPDATRFPRQALHAATLGFVHPVRGGSISFTSPLPQDMRDLVASLETL